MLPLLLLNVYEQIFYKQSILIDTFRQIEISFFQVLLKPPTTDPPTHRPTDHLPTNLRKNRRPDFEHVLHSMILENLIL